MKISSFRDFRDNDLTGLLAMSFTSPTDVGLRRKRDIIIGTSINAMRFIVVVRINRGR